MPEQKEGDSLMFGGPPIGTSSLIRTLHFSMQFDDVLLRGIKRHTIRITGLEQVRPGDAIRLFCSNGRREGARNFARWNVDGRDHPVTTVETVRVRGFVRDLNGVVRDHPKLEKWQEGAGGFREITQREYQALARQDGFATPGEYWAFWGSYWTSVPTEALMVSW
jgi:hypothetical protein